MKVQDLMTNPVFTCTPGEPLNEAARLMWERDCGCVPVVDSEKRIVGMLTDRDIAMAAYTKGRRLAEISTAEAMSSRPIAVHPKDDVADVVETMSRSAIRRVPVVDEDARVVGIVSLNDLARAAAKEPDRPQPRGQVIPTQGNVAATLAAISEPRRA